MNGLLLQLLFLFGQKAKVRVLREAKKRGLAVYLKAINGLRRSLLAGLLMLFFMQAILLAGVGALVTGLWLWDYDLHAKMQFAFGLCLGLFIVPVILITVALSERTWYRFTGAEKMVNDLLNSEKDT